MSWLGGSRAVAVLSFDVDAESPILAMGRRYADHAMVMTPSGLRAASGCPTAARAARRVRAARDVLRPGTHGRSLSRVVERIADAGHEVGHHSYSHRSPVDLSESGERADFERALSALERVGRAAGRPSRGAVGGELAYARARCRIRAGVRLEPDGCRPPLPAAHRPRHDRRAAAPLEPRRLGAVRLPAAAEHRRRHRVAAQGARDLARPSSTRCAAIGACSCSPATRSCRGARRGWRRFGS